MKSSVKVAPVILFFCLCIAVSILAGDIPQLINIQGLLTDSSDEPIADGTHSVTFAIYSVSSGGSAQWTETRTVTTEDGLFTIILGETNPLADSLFTNPELWLGITVSGDTEMAPRQRLTSVPYVYRALDADTASCALSVVDGAIQLDDIAQNGAVQDQIIKWNGSAWSVADDEGGSSSTGGGWTDDGRIVRLTAGEDSVGIGTSTPTAKLDVDGDVIITGKTTFGTGHTNTGYRATITGGNGSIASGEYAVISGGESNLADSLLTTVGGGQGNIASGTGTTVGGGVANQAFAFFSTIAGGGPYDLEDILNTNNKAYDQYCTIGGGSGNRVGTDDGDINDGAHSTIAGGIRNTADGYLSTVGGGEVNTASARSATVGGGSDNTASDQGATVAGGWQNSATNAYAAISGGSLNKASGSSSFVGGGVHCRARGLRSVVCGGGGWTSNDTNSALGDWSVIGGGRGNAVYDSGAVIGGGCFNRAHGAYSVIAGGGGGQIADSNSTVGSWTVVGGGRGNNADGNGATVSGGFWNSATGYYATVAGGINNNATDHYASIGGGWNNTASCTLSTVVGGNGNEATGYCSTIPGGEENIAGGDYSFAAGLLAHAIHNGTFVWADNYAAAFQSTGVNQFLIRASGGVGIGTVSPGAMLDVADDDRALRLRAGNGQAEFTDNQIMLSYGGTVNYSHAIKSRHSGSSSARNAIDFYVWDQAVDGVTEVGTKHVMTIDGDGNGEVGIGTTEPNYTLDVRGTIGNNTTLYHSDVRWKTDIETIPNALEKVSALRGVNFEWRQDEYAEMNFPSGKHLGVIAQEVENVLPELVNTADDGYKSVEYANLTALLIEAVKELKSENEALQSRIAILEESGAK